MYVIQIDLLDLRIAGQFVFLAMVHDGISLVWTPTRTIAGH